ncbi:MaoC family dehydratase N-terminal domain-containing protein [Robertmurraya kyonggiensis]|uniref:MaoC family dehydratase n=1 Tax=Robertmurraya kyonggiensis TaxID=1037680 RepID=A0A4U1D9U3_9BACI|nr:MaoC family dehydratase N-terminal domain-containing protein [Robertmurraya kyonggiensis]TKC19335.1 MaoC family dehydratase [Robertmurraya kyonggiensis]
MLSESVGKKSNKVRNTVEKGAVKKFAEAVGDLQTIYIDEKVGKNSRYKTNIAPPTFPRVFDFGIIEGFKLPSVGLIHGEQHYHYERPLLVGEEVQCYSEVHSYVEKTGSFGKMGFLSIKQYGEDINGELIFSSEQIIIVPEAVARGLGI